jgi:ribosomal protein L11 methyltransferase
MVLLEPIATAPVLVAPRVWLHDASRPPPPTPPGAHARAVHPSSAFGDGTHPTTRLCARAVDLACRLGPPRSVLDVGTGTGVLARIARAHGVTFVAATDLDPRALAAARANAALDPTRGELSIDARAPDAFGRRFELVVANILEPVLLALAPALTAALASGGALVLSGFTPAQTPSLRAAFGARGLGLEVQATLEGWALLQLRARAD